MPQEAVLHDMRSQNGLRKYSEGANQAAYKGCRLKGSENGSIMPAGYVRVFDGLLRRTGVWVIGGRALLAMSPLGAI